MNLFALIFGRRPKPTKPRLKLEGLVRKKEIAMRAQTRPPPRPGSAKARRAQIRRDLGE